ncbi:MAG: NAD(P)-dependent oxidoreductase [Desulfobacterales bacterium S5133MH16]|nr:MAG: NAD(P)-dependent oxidoreductase [Desulfobacterales bacterium S5133MH16]
MRILILGGDGMLGHQLFKNLKSSHDVRVTLRQDLAVYNKFMMFSSENTYPGIDVSKIDKLAKVLTNFHPDAVVNAIGIVKQLPEANKSIPSLEINALFPHRLALLCKEISARMIHLSTDCVFSGKKGNYKESDTSDPDDLYGRTKLLGEVSEKHCLTLRTSIIGQELSRKKNLLEWFLSQKGSVNGYKKAIFSGFTTLELSRIIENMILNYPDASGIYHVSSDPISKFDLLSLIKAALKLPVEIISDESFACDRSLDSSKFRREFNYNPPSWEEMICELCKDIGDNS